MLWNFELGDKNNTNKNSKQLHQSVAINFNIKV